MLTWSLSPRLPISVRLFLFVFTSVEQDLHRRYADGGGWFDPRRPHFTANQTPHVACMTLYLVALSSACALRM